MFIRIQGSRRCCTTMPVHTTRSSCSSIRVCVSHMDGTHWLVDTGNHETAVHLREAIASCFCHSLSCCSPHATAMQPSAGLVKASPSTACSQRCNTRINLAGRMLSAHRSRSGRLSLSAVASTERMLKTVNAETLSDQEIKNLLQRPRIDFTSILSTVGRQQQMAAFA